MPPQIKICCISSRAEALLAANDGARALGLVSAMPSGPGVIDEATIAAIARGVPPPTATVLLTSRVTGVGIAEQHQRCRTSAIQICDRLDPEEYSILRDLCPDTALIQVIHVAGPAAIQEANESAELADGLLLDSGNPGLPVKELGGTGRVHDWELSAEIQRVSSVPVLLAGGLRAGNVSRAIELVRPWGLDLCSGVRTDGHLDRRKLTEFMAAASAVPHLEAERRE